MPSFWGADTESVRALATSMSTASVRLGEIVSDLDRSVLREDIWMGIDAEDFRARFSGTVRPAAIEAMSSVRERADLLLDEAHQQDEVSADDSGDHQQRPDHDAAIDGIIAGVSTVRDFADHRGDERSARRGEGRRNTPRRDGDEDFDPDADNPNAQYSTPGPPATAPGASGLGPGVPGTEAQAPEPPAWTPPADGAGEYNSEIAGPIDHSTHSLAREGADLTRGAWPHAAEHLDHFLDNTGEDYDADVDDLISQEKGLADEAESRRHDAGKDAVAQAQAEGATGPVTFPLSTSWDPYTVDSGRDWFYASGSFNYNQTGTVTVYPPDSSNPEWRYEVDTHVNFRDRYNWDGGKQTTIGPFVVTDESLAALHRGGIAKEYNLVGESSPQHTTGSVP